MYVASVQVNMNITYHYKLFLLYVQCANTRTIFSMKKKTLKVHIIPVCMICYMFRKQCIYLFYEM